MKKTTLRQAALKLALLAFVLLSPLGLRAQQSLPYSYGFEDNDLSTDGWSTQNPSGLNASEFGINTSAAQTGSYGFRFSSYTDDGISTQYLISPELDAPSGVVVQFSYKKSSNNGTETFKVGYSTTDSDISSFTFGSEISASTSWTLSDEFNFPAGTKYIAIYYYPSYQYRLYIDNITFNAPASCPKPTGLTCTATTGTPATATLSWTNGGTETNWVLEYSTAADFTGATTINISDGDLNDGTYTLTTGLTAETRYYAHLKADCGGGDESEWSNTIDFKPSNVQNIPIGSGNSTTNYFPSHTNWKYSYTQQIYTASEIGQAGTIKSISFKGNKAGTRSWVIYLVNTTKESFSSTNDFISIADATQVFNDNVTLVANDWTTIELDGDGFDYQGENLAIIVDDNSGNYTMGSTNWDAFSTASTNQALYFYQDSGTPANIDPTSPNASNKNISTYKSQIKLGILPSNTPKPRNLHFDNVTSIAATMIWEEPNITPDSYEYQYKVSADEWPAAWTTNGTNLSVILSLSASTTYDFRVRATYSEGESDPVEIQFTTLDNCAYPTNLTASTTPGQGTKATLTWVKGYDEEAWVLEYSTDNFVSDIHPVTEGFAIDGNTVTANLTGLTPETHYYARVKAVCSATSSSSWSNVAEFNPTNFVNYTYNDGATSSTTYHPFYGSYSNNATNQSQFVIPAAELSSDIIGGTIRSITYYTTSTATTDWGGVVFDVYMAEVENSTFSYYATFVDWDNLNNVYTGTVSLSNGMMTIVFDNNYTYNGGNLLIGFKTNTPGTTTQSISWTASYPSGAYNIAYQTGSSAYGSAYSPKITFNYLPTAYPRVAEVNEGTITTTSAQLTWAAPETEATITGYAYQYKLSSAAEWPTTWSNLAANATSVTLQPLTAGSSYDFRIKVLYGEHESVITSKSFYTECAAITTFPWRENFDTRSFGNFSDPCWVNEHLTVVGDYASTVFTVEASNNENRINLLKLPDESIGNTIKLRLPQMTLPNDNYQFVLDVYRSNSTYNNNYPDEGIRVYASTDGEIEGATELTFIPRQYNVSSTLIPEETAEGWYTYEIPIGISGTCYIILRGESQYCTSTYIDNFVVEPIPTCRKPINPDATATTAHTATLGWTNGEEGQDAWQIAYSTNSSFAPASDFTPGENEWLVGVTTNPATLTELDNDNNNGQTYYAYVRANCGSEDGLSAWSATPAIFTTIAGNLPPAAFQITEIQTRQVGLDWTPAGNDNESSWTILLHSADIANINTLADEDLPSTDMRNAGSHPTAITNLTPGTTYYAWIRSNNQADGVSSWVAIDGAYFTTLPECPYPQNLTVGTVTAQEATVAWDGNNENNSYTLKYRKATTAPVDVNETYDFEDGTLQGWTTISNDNDNNAWSVQSSSSNAHQSSYCVRSRYTSSTAGGDANDWLISPQIPLGGTFSFYARRHNTSTDQFQVYVSTTGNDISDFTPISEVITPNTTYDSYDYDLSDYSGNGYVAIVYTAPNNQYYVYIDDITYTNTIPGDYEDWQTVENATNPYTINNLDPESYYEVKVYGVCGSTMEAIGSNTEGFTTLEACAAPTAFTLSTVTTHEATFSWTAGNGNEAWKVYVKKHTDAEYPETYTVVTTLPTTEAPFSTGTTLVANTAYDVKIVPTCDPTKFLEVENAFTTDYEYLTLPYNTSFDAADDADWRLVNSTSHDNKWVIGEAAGNGDPTRGLYISNDNGTNNAYNNSGHCVVFAYAGFSNFEASKQYTVSFDWKNNGEGQNQPYDFIRAWLVPANAEFYANTSNEYPAGMTSATGNPTDWISLDNNTPLKNVTTWQTNTAYVTVPTDGAYKLVFMWRQDGSAGTNPPAAIDNVSIDESEKYTVTVNVDNTMGSVTSTPAVLSDIYENTTVTLEATANEGYHFVNWTNNVTEDITNPISFTLSQDTTYTANFEINTYTITAAADPIEGGIVSVEGTFEHGTQATLTATANEGYAFVNWTLNDEEVSNNATYTISSVSADGDYVAHFVPTYVINATANPAEGGTVEGADTYNQGSNATLTATANEGYTFVNWTLNDEVVSNNATYTINSVSEAADYVANFEINTYTITATANPTEGGTVEGADTYNHGSNATLTATPSEGYYFVNWTKGGEEVSANSSFSITVTENADYVANFAAYDVYTKNIDANKWYAISSPVHNSGDNETLAGVNNLTSGTYDLYLYNENEGKWVKETSSLAVGKGYIYRRANDVTLSFVGIANTGSISVNVSSSCPDNDLKGFNLIGNPYMHAIAIDDDHYTLNTNGTWQAHTSGTIGVAEAFLVQTSEGGSFDFSDQLPANDNTANSALAFTVSNGEYSDVAYARLEEGNGLRKIGHLNSEAPMLSIPVEGSRYAVANVGSDCQSFNLVFRGVNGTYTIKQSSNQAIAYCHLIDRVAGKDIDMLRQNYTFSSNGFDPDRFMVKLSPDAQENTGSNFAYWNGNSWMVEGNGTLQVFDALGRQLFSQEISNSNFEIQNSLFPAAGVYVLRMGEKTQKIVVR